MDRQTCDRIVYGMSLQRERYTTLGDVLFEENNQLQSDNGYSASHHPELGYFPNGRPGLMLSRLIV